MSQPVLTAGARAISTKGALNSLRREGKIPAVVYNRHGKATSISLDEIAFFKATKGVSESTIVKLLIDGKETECFIKDRQLDWLKGKLVHVDFFEVESGVSIRLKVSIHLIGTPVGVREGGILENPVHEVEVECLPKDLPSHFDIDVSELHANHSIHVRDIKRTDGVKILSSADQVVALVKFAKADAAAEAPAATTAEAGATPAAGAAAPAAGAAPAAAAAPAAKK